MNIQEGSCFQQSTAYYNTETVTTIEEGAFLITLDQIGKRAEYILNKNTKFAEEAEENHGEEESARMLGTIFFSVLVQA